MATAKRFVVKNGLDNNSQTIINVTDPSNDSDAATKNFAKNASNLTTGSISDSIHGNLGGGSLHSAVTTSVNGFMSATDKTKLDSITSGASVSSVAMTVPTGLTIGGTPVTTTGTLAITLTSGYSIPTTSSQGNWDTAYTDRLKWDGGSTGLTASTGRTSLGATAVGSNVFTLTNPSAITFLKINADNTVSTESAFTFRTSIGATTVGGNLFTLTNPSAVTFIRVNADNTITTLDAASFRTAIGAGTSSTSGTVTSVSGTGTVSGITLSGTVTTSGNLTLGGTLSVDHGTTTGLSDDDHTQYILASGTRAFSGTVSGVTPTADAHLTTKAYVDSVAQGLDVKASCRVATTAPITTLAGGAPNTLDDITLVVGDRVLVKDQSTASQNGIYVVDTVGTGANGSWSRATDFDGSPAAEVTSGAFTFVTDGTLNGGNGWVLTTNGTITIGSTSLTFAQFSGGGEIISGTGLTKTGNTLNVIGTAGNIVANADSIDLATVTPGTGSNFVKITVDNYGRVTGSTSVSSNDITTLIGSSTYAAYAHVGATGTAHGVASISIAGFMSAADKTKLDSITSGASVSSVGLSVPTGLTLSTGATSPITTSGNYNITFSSGYSIPTTSSQSNWDTAYTDRMKWDGGSTGLTASTGRTSLGATTVGGNLFMLADPSAITFIKINANNSVSTESASTFRTSIGATTVGGNLFTLTNPSAITFIRVNADNTVTALDAASFRTAIGAGTSSTSGTVTSVSGTGTVSGITLTGTVTGSGNLTLGGTLSFAHSSLTGLTTGDDHTQYILTSGARNSLPLSYSNISSAVLVTSTTSAGQVVDLTATATYRSAKYLIQVVSGSAFQLTELLVVRDDSSVAYITEFGTILTGANLATFNADVNGGNLRLLVTPVNDITTIKVVKIAIIN